MSLQLRLLKTLSPAGFKVPSVGCKKNSGLNFYGCKTAFLLLAAVLK